MSAPTVDPITLEVLRETFSSIVREMRVTLVRTAYSSILYEGEDFSCVLMDGDAQLVAMSKGQDHPLHIVPSLDTKRCARSSATTSTRATSSCTTTPTPAART
jgi:N-methylhydantoinase B/oxoprolinase/acetone carboxylase alpha subunit